MSVYTGWWSERAGRAEQDADRMAALVEQLVRETNLPDRHWRTAHDCLRDYRANRARRYGPLPAGHTLEGSLKSGGI